ncbi:Uncharacterized protein QTN25_002735 [Entamoeba marina]
MTNSNDFDNVEKKDLSPTTLTSPSNVEINESKSTTTIFEVHHEQQSPYLHVSQRIDELDINSNVPINIEQIINDLKIYETVGIHLIDFDATEKTPNVVIDDLNSGQNVSEMKNRYNNISEQQLNGIDDDNNEIIDEIVVEIDNQEMQDNESHNKSLKELSRRKRNRFRQAAEEYYRGLALLQNYCTLNNEEIVRILTKYDKTNGYSRKDDIIRDNLLTTKFYKMEELKLLLTETEKLFGNVFQGDDVCKIKAINHSVSPIRAWKLGLLMGLTILLGLLVIYHVVNYVIDIQSETIGTNTTKITEYDGMSILIISRGLFLPSLLQCLWGINMYIFRKVRINYPFLLDFNKNKIDYILSLGTGTSQVCIILLSLFLTFLCLSPPSGFSFLSNIPYWVCTLFGLSCCAFVFGFRQSYHHWFIRTFGRISVSPRHKVLFKDYLIGDQMTSLSIIYGDYVFSIGFFIYGFINYKDNGDGSNSESHLFAGSNFIEYRKYFIPVLQAVPFFYRMLQCLRSARDSKNKYQLVNALKYFISVINQLVGGINTLYRPLTIPLWIVVGIITAIYSATWDVKMDWGLTKMKYKLLRKKKFYPIWLYYFSMTLDIIMRFTLFVNITIIFFSWFSDHLLINELILTVLAIIEVVRRGHWNIYRVEFEQTSDMDKFRATKEIPLPLAD